MSQLGRGQALGQAGDAATRRALEAHLVACVHRSLEDAIFSNAIFLCERLVAEFRSESNLALLGKCYLRSNAPHRAYHLLRGRSGEESRYAFALACLELGKVQEALAALLKDQDPRSVPNGAAGLYLTGRAYLLANDANSAARFFEAALRVDPTMWAAYSELCDLHSVERVSRYRARLEGAVKWDAAAGPEPSRSDAFPQDDATPAAATAGAAEPLGRPAAPVKSRLGGRSLQTPAERVRAAIETPDSDLSQGMVEQGDEATPALVPAPSAGAMDFATPASDDAEFRIARGPPPVARRPAPSTSTPTGQLTFSVPERAKHGRAPRGRFAEEGKWRKVPIRLFCEELGFQGDSPGPLNKGPWPEDVNFTNFPAGELATMRMLAPIANAAWALANCEPNKAIRLFQGLPSNQYGTGWVLVQIGRACYEKGDYASAAQAYEIAREIDRCRLEGLEYYSTVLWHLGKEDELAGLAYEAVSLDRHSPIAWCILGNCFSLQKDRETSLRYFQRALQLDPRFAYAYSLAGHEYFANEDFSKASACFKNALRIDPRLYNAWFGLGQLHFRKENYSAAEYHFYRAVKINPHSSVLVCHFGKAVAQRKAQKDAMDCFAQAHAIDPKNPMALFELGNVQQELGMYHDALRSFQALQEMVPYDSSVPFAMGNICKRLGDLQSAMRHYNAALDLRPASADSTRIRAALERLRVSNEEDPGEM